MSWFPILDFVVLVCLPDWVRALILKIAMILEGIAKMAKYLKIAIISNFSHSKSYNSTKHSTLMNFSIFRQPFSYKAKSRNSIEPSRCHLRRQPRRLPLSSPSCKLANLLAAVISIHNGPLSTDFAHVHRPRAAEGFRIPALWTGAANTFIRGTNPCSTSGLRRSSSQESAGNLI